MSANDMGFIITVATWLVAAVIPCIIVAGILMDVVPIVWHKLEAYYYNKQINKLK